MAAQVVQSAQFAEIHANFVKKLDSRRFEAQKHLDEVFEKFDEMDIKMKDLRTQFKKDKKEARKARLDQSGESLNHQRADVVVEGENEVKKVNPLDITDDMLNMFIRFDVQRRFFNIVAMEVLAKQFNMKKPTCLLDYYGAQNKISLKYLIQNGRSITLDQFLKHKNDFESDPKAV